MSLGTVKHVKDTLLKSVIDHMLNCRNVAAWEDCSIIGSESNNYLLQTKKVFSLRDNPSLNGNKYSKELFLYSFCLESTIDVTVIPLTPTRYPTSFKKIQLAFCKRYGGVKTVSKESFPYIT